MRILYATDGSAPARTPERLIASLFDRDSCEIETFCVNRELHYLASADESYELVRLDLPPLDAEHIAREAADHLAKEGFTTHGSASRGDAAIEILKATERDAYDLVILGASHTSWMGNVLLGSVSMNVLHHAPCSVLVTHHVPNDDGKVLWAVDGSRSSMEAVTTMSDLFDRSRCSVTVAGVVPPGGIPAAFYAAVPFGGYADPRHLEEQEIDRAWTWVERARASLEGTGFRTEGSVLVGNAGPQLLKEADNIGAELVVAGSRGLGGLRRAFLGSVSDQLVRHAPATLVVRGGRVPGGT